MVDCLRVNAEGIDEMVSKVQEAIATVRIIPNHVCSTVNLHDVVYLTDEDGTVEEVPVTARGKVR